MSREEERKKGRKEEREEEWPLRNPLQEGVGTFSTEKESQLNRLQSPMETNGENGARYAPVNR